MKFDIAKLDSQFEVIQESMKQEKVYLADKTGWGAQSKRKQVIEWNRAKHVSWRKANDESHKTLIFAGIYPSSFINACF